MYQRMTEAREVSPWCAMASAPGDSSSTSRRLAQSLAAALDEKVLVSSWTMTLPSRRRRRAVYPVVPSLRALAMMFAMSSIQRPHNIFVAKMWPRQAKYSEETPENPV